MEQIANLEQNRKKYSKFRPAAWALGMAVAALAVFLGSYAVRADDDAGSGPTGAARLSSVEGQVRLMQDGQVIADAAPANAPLFAGTRIETGDDGKAEVQFDDGSIARISPSSALTIQSIGGDGSAGTDMVLENGLAYFELPGNTQDGQTRVLFGDSVATVTGFTVMRVRRDAPPDELAVFSGNAHLERGNNMQVDVRGGESITLDASDPGRYNIANNIEPDSWDQWNTDRDQALTAAASDQTSATSNYVNSDNPNPQWNDLDANGNWYNVPGQGYVWSPFVAASASWDPYGCGHWMYTPRFGYVWVSCENWGYLPYSCGSWNFYSGFGWGWAPGMGRCTPWWRRGSYVGWNVGNVPSWYHTTPRPILRNPRGRNPIINVNHHADGGPSDLPQRGRNNPVMISGRQVEPMQRIPEHNSYVRSTSGFVYHPTNGYQQPRDGGQVERGNNDNNQPPATNRPVYQHNQTDNSYVRRANPGQGGGYVPPAQGNSPDRNNNSDRNNNTPAPIITQPGRIIVPPNQNRQDPGRTYTPPPQQNQPQPRQYTPPPQPQQPRAEQPQPRQYTPPPQPQPTRPAEPSRQYTPPPSQHNSGGGNAGGGSYARPSGGPAGGGGAHGGSAPAGGNANAPVHH